MGLCFNVPVKLSTLNKIDKWTHICIHTCAHAHANTHYLSIYLYTHRRAEEEYDILVQQEQQQITSRGFQPKVSEPFILYHLTLNACTCSHLADGKLLGVKKQHHPIFIMLLYNWLTKQQICDN